MESSVHSSLWEVAIWIVLLFICVFILYGEYTMRNAENSNKEPKENAQDSPLAVDTYEEENHVIMNEYQTKFQDAVNTYEIKDGKLYGSGANTSGQLGIGEITSQDFYEQQILIAENVIHMDACGETLVYLNDKNELYGVGNNGSGQLGQSVEEQDRRTYIAYVADNGRNRCCVTEPVFIMDHVKYAAVGGGYLMVLQEDGTLYTMGANLNGQLGNTRRGNGIPSVSTDVVSEPYLVLKKIKEVYFEDFTVYAVDFQNQKYSWGKNAVTSPKLMKNTRDGR